MNFKIYFLVLILIIHPAYCMQENIVIAKSPRKSQAALTLPAQCYKLLTYAASANHALTAHPTETGLALWDLKDTAVAYFDQPINNLAERKPINLILDFAKKPAPLYHFIFFKKIKRDIQPIHEQMFLDEATNTIAYLTKKRTLYVWDIKTAKRIHRCSNFLDNTNFIDSIALFYNKSATLIALIYPSGEVVIMNLLDKQHVATIELPKGRFKSMLFAPDGKRLAIYSTAAIYIANINTKKYQALPHNNSIETYMFSYNPDIFITTTEGYITIWGTKDGKRISSTACAGSQFSLLDFVN